MVGMEDRAGGEAVIRALHQRQVEGRAVTVKWKEEGMWTCPDPTCGKANFEDRERCVACRLRRFATHA